MIPWRPIAELPDELKDGREVLLWFAPEYAEAGPIVGDWYETGWLDEQGVGISSITHFAEIIPP